MKKAPKGAAREQPDARGGRTGSGRVRIIGGAWRRTPLAVVDTPGLRPTPDRVRETVFNWLAHLCGGPDGALRGLAVLDLFAGSGALGLEAASRGAAPVVLLERDARAAAALRAAREKLGAAAVEVRQADWRAALAAVAPASLDLVFLDPPYDSGLLAPALAAARPLLRPGGWVYAEDLQPATEAQAAALGLELVRSGHAGVVFFHLLRAPPY